MESASETGKVAINNLFYSICAARKDNNNNKKKNKHTTIITIAFTYIFTTFDIFHAL